MIINKKEALTEAKKRKRKSKLPCDSVSYTTGDISLNIDRFNQAMGTNFNTTGVAEGGALTEAKRYVRRYYIRPMNIFCSNKAEIIKALIEIGNKNCSVYTLNNLGDDKDVSKLMNSDIIYYYDDGILFDKNKVKVMDYDLSIKKEENRKHFNNVDKAPEKEFKAEYEDRMTKATELEESTIPKRLNFTYEDFAKALRSALAKNTFLDIGQSFDDEDACSYNWEVDQSGDKIVVTGWGYNIYTEEDGIEKSEYFDTMEDAYEYIETIAQADARAELALPEQLKEAFSLDFEDVNVYGERLTEATEKSCIICGEPLGDAGNDPEPYMSADKGRACHGCYLKFVLPMKNEVMED